jgi:hypothetical protein
MTGIVNRSPIVSLRKIPKSDTFPIINKIPNNFSLFKENCLLRLQTIWNFHFVIVVCCCWWWDFEIDLGFVTERSSVTCRFQWEQTWTSLQIQRIRRKKVGMNVRRYSPLWDNFVVRYSNCWELEEVLPLVAKWTYQQFEVHPTERVEDILQECISRQHQRVWTDKDVISQERHH